jgi:hypothetical protein
LSIFAAKIDRNRRATLTAPRSAHVVKAFNTLFPGFELHRRFGSAGQARQSGAHSDLSGIESPQTTAALMTSLVAVHNMTLCIRSASAPRVGGGAWAVPVGEISPDG